MAVKIKKIDIKIKGTDTLGIFHDSRKDIKTLSKVSSVVISKLNEMIDKVNYLEQLIEDKS